MCIRDSSTRISKRGCYDNDYYGEVLGKKRDISEVVCHNCKVKGHYPNKYPAKKPLPGDSTTKWFSLHKTRSHSDNECMGQQATPQSLPPGSALPATISPATEACSFTFVASSSFSSIKKVGLQLLVDSGCSSHMVDPVMIPNADQHLREYQALQPPKIIEVTQPLELVYTDLSGTISPASGAGN